MNPRDIAADRFSAEKMQKVNLFETPNLFCDVYCLEPGQKQKPHRHDDADKIYYVIEGEGHFLVGEGEQVMASGEIILAAAGVEHGVSNRGSARLTVLVFMTPNPNFRK